MLDLICVTPNGLLPTSSTLPSLSLLGRACVMHQAVTSIPNASVNKSFILLKMSKSKSHYNRRSVSQSVCQGIEPTLGLVTRYYFLSEGCFLKVAVLSLWGTLSDERSGLSIVILSM
jgi:hypothetical protein